MSASMSTTELVSESSPSILCVGLACLDIVNHCEYYPTEDSDVRATDQRWSSGGNALNTCKVLSLIGRSCELLCTLGEGMETDFVLSEMRAHGVQHSCCVSHPHCRLPTSYIVLNTTNGSRTIVHYRNLPELTYEDFLKVDISKFSWIHFEGRCPEVYSQLIARVQQHNETAEHKITISIEIEKTKINFSALFPLGDVLVVSKDVAKFLGYQSMQETVVSLRGKVKESAIVVCPWGDQGAAASDRDGKVYQCPATPPARLVDTLGAGDTFNAGLIHSLSGGRSLESALQYACDIAGAKCGMSGFEQLKHFHS